MITVTEIVSLAEVTETKLRIIQVIEEEKNTYFHINYIITDVNTDLNSDCFMCIEKQCIRTMIRYIFRNTTIMVDIFCEDKDKVIRE